MNKRCRFFTGVIFGLVIGFLFAPFKGEEMREKVKEKYDEFKDDPKETAKSNFELLIERLENTTKSFNDKLEEVMDDCEFEEVGEDIIIKRTFENEDEVIDVKDDVLLHDDDEVILDLKKQENSEKDN